MSRDLDEYSDPDLVAEAREESRRQRQAFGPCQCFGPGEAGGTCPGPANCPLCDEGDDE